ncbi:MAG: class I SAM-dependent methyltransferase [Lachnospiraceae bacterium]|nr:class I SAM-dependent methyltransferase [Lachnospiraceae bacterium]
MREYSGFSQVYDLFMDNIPYKKWCRYLVSLLRAQGVKDGIVAELGCGTGQMTRLLRDAGYDMIGIDMSPDMLGVAREKEQGGDESILYLQQDMREFELYGTVAAIVSVCDSLNYLTNPDDLLKVFKLAKNYLDPGGVMIFDINTRYYYSHVLGDSTVCENREEGSFIWENEWNETTFINSSYLTIYHKIENDGEELYERLEEEHRQRGFTSGEILHYARRAGLTPVNIYEAFTKKAPGRTCERMYFVLRNA